MTFMDSLIVSVNFFLFSYNLAYFILTYCIPLLIMGACYLQMGRKLWGQEPIGEDTPSLAKCRKTKQKVVSFLIHTPFYSQ